VISPREFWTPILTHPDVEPMVLAGMGTVDDFLWWIDQPGVHEERYEGGGLVYVDKEDAQEVHVAFLPSAWGRSVAMSFREIFSRKMKDIRVVIANEQEGMWRTRPPLSHGWVAVEEFKDSVLPRRTRKWILTQDAWYRSPVGRKCNELHH